MKILDGEGRLFGKMNIVDLGIILLLLIVIPAFFHTYTILGKRPTVVPHEWIGVEAVTFTTPEIAALLEEGDTSFNEVGEPDGKLLRIIGEAPAYSNKGKNTVPIKLEFELLSEYSAEREHWYYRRSRLLVDRDNTFVFTCRKYRITCYAVKIKD